MSAVGLRVVLGVQWQTRRRGLVTWVLALGAGMVLTAALVAGLYTTPAEIHTYAQAVTAGSALAAINGRVEGIDSLGGIVQDEFGFLAAILMPLLGISLVTRQTRREEETGRLEAVLAGRVARHVPPLAALVVATSAILVTATIFAVGLVAEGVPVPGSVLYAASLGALAFVFAGVAALLAQLVLHARGVYTWALLVLAASYVLRGIGDVNGSWVTWLSPLGWAEKAAPFGPERWTALLIPLVVGSTCAGFAVRLASRRDLGSALVRGGPGPSHASARLRTTTGLAVWIQRPGTLGWLAGALALAALMGSLAHQFLDAMAGNPALAEAIGAAGPRPQHAFLAMTQLYAAVIASGYVVQSVGALRTEETSGRLEPCLARPLSRQRWLAEQLAVILGGLLVIVLAESLVLGLTTAWSVGSGADLASTLGAGAAYLPAELVLAGLALAVFGLWPRAFPAAWAVFAAVAFIALLGPGLKLADWVRDLAPTTHVGNPPQASVGWVALAVLSAVGAALIAVAFVGFRRRGVPQG